MTSHEPDNEPPAPGIDEPKPEPGKRRELTPDEREELRKKLEEAEEDDPNIYPVF